MEALLLTFLPKDAFEHGLLTMPRKLLIFTLIILGSAITNQTRAAEDKRPNILFIYTDDQSYRTVSCYPGSYDFAQTPNIDALARQGIRFDAAYIGTWCMPSRAALLTGHLQHGVQSMRMEGQYPGSEYNPNQCPFWPSVFRANGYQTAQIGKWHTGRDNGFGRDWDYQMVWNRPRYPENAGAYYENQLIEENGKPARLVPGYSTDNYTNWAIDYIEGENRDAEKPWYLWLCYGAVHGPFTPAKRHLQTLPDVNIPVPADIFPPRPGKPDWMQKIEHWIPDANGTPVMKGNGFTAQTVDTKGIHGNTLNDWVRQYHQGVIAIDEGVGRIMEALERSDQLENTLVVFTADQGIGWGQHGFRVKLAPYDATIRSPLIVSLPGQLPTGKTSKTPVSGVDLVPTFFQFADIELPWKMHGESLLPLLKQPHTRSNKTALTVMTGKKYGQDTEAIPTEREDLYINNVPWWVSLRDGHYKYIRTLVAGETEELYDLKRDPEELINLAHQKRYRLKVQQLRQDMIGELRQVDAKFVDNLPPVGTGY